MAAEPVIDAIGIVASDLAVSVAFYRRLGLAFPADEADDHVEAPIGTTGVRVMIDSEELMKGLDPDFEGNPLGGSHSRSGSGLRRTSTRSTRSSPPTGSAGRTRMTRPGGSATRRWPTRTARPWTSTPRCRSPRRPDGLPVSVPVRT